MEAFNKKIVCNLPFFGFNRDSDSGFPTSWKGDGGAKKTGILENVVAIFGLHVASLSLIVCVSGRACLLYSTHLNENESTILTFYHQWIYFSLILQVATAGNFNVIPDSVTIGGTFRAFSKESLMQLKQRIEDVWLAKKQWLACPSYPHLEGSSIGNCNSCWPCDLGHVQINPLTFGNHHALGFVD